MKCFISENFSSGPALHYNLLLHIYFQSTLFWWWDLQLTNLLPILNKDSFITDVLSIKTHFYPPLSIHYPLLTKIVNLARSRYSHGS